MRRALKALLLLLLLRAAPALAADVPVEAWLKKPGVRWVAIQSYPKVCPACRKAASRWQALADRFRPLGLRVLTISARDPMTGCLDPGWEPDHIVCDYFYDGIAKDWVLRAKNPTVYLWRWDGNLLVERAEIGAVERVLKRSAERLPRMVVDVRQSEGDTGEIREAFRQSITDTHKYTPASRGSEEARLRLLGNASYAKLYEKARPCEQGRGLLTDALLGVRLVGKRVEVTLRSEEGCRLSGVTVPWDHFERIDSAGKAMASLFAAVPRRVQRAKPKKSADVPLQGLIPDGDTPEGQLMKTKHRLASLESPMGKRLARIVTKWLGTPFERGGTSESGIDGPAFARAVIKEASGIDIGAKLERQIDCGPEVPVDLRDPTRTLVPGDLIFFVSYAYLVRGVSVYLGKGYVAQAVDVRGIVVDPMPKDMPYYFYLVARRPRPEP